MTATSEILQSIELRLSQLREEISALQSARAALDGRNGQAAAPRPRRTAPDRAERVGPDRAKRAASERAKEAPAARAEDAPAAEDAAAARADEAPATHAAVEPPPPPSEGEQPAATKPQRARLAQRRRRSPAKQGTTVVPAGKLELLLAATDGLTTTALAEHADASRDQVLTLLREMEARGTVRRVGQRRGTRWHLITDEERIAQRAAELAAQSRAATS
ncbi:MAG: hypothetical protein ACLP50_00615 [Solirubrobacteraceae bacterium]